MSWIVVTDEDIRKQREWLQRQLDQIIEEAKTNPYSLRPPIDCGPRWACPECQRLRARVAELERTYEPVAEGE